MTLFPSRLSNAAGLQEGLGHHHHAALPGRSIGRWQDRSSDALECQSLRAAGMRPRDHIQRLPA